MRTGSSGKNQRNAPSNIKISSSRLVCFNRCVAIATAVAVLCCSFALRRLASLFAPVLFAFLRYPLLHLLYFVFFYCLTHYINHSNKNLLQLFLSLSSSVSFLVSLSLFKVHSFIYICIHIYMIGHEIDMCELFHVLFCIIF